MSPTPVASWPALLQPFDPKALPPGIWVLLVIWTLVWKGVALWRAARAGQPGWFVAVLVVQTVGLLEITYLLFFAGRDAASAGEPGAPWAEAPAGTVPSGAGARRPPAGEGEPHARP